MSTARDRYTFIAPLDKLDQVRAILGAGSFQTPLFTPGVNDPTHYIAAAHPSQVTDEQREALDAIPAVRCYSLATSVQRAESQ